VASGDSRGAQAGFRYGGGEGPTSWRVYGKHLDMRHTELAGGGAINDARHQSQVGFRVDGQRGADSWTVQGGAMRGRSGQAEPGVLTVTGINPVLEDIATGGVNLSGAWERQLDAGGSVRVRGAVERAERRAWPTFSQAVNIAQLQLLHTLPALGAHSVVWGLGHRRSWDKVDSSEIVAFLPAYARQAWSSIFVQDEVALRDNLELTVGVRAARNPYTGNEWLPTLRLAWKAAPAHLLWTGLSRTVRAPSRLDADAFVPGKPPYLLRGGPLVRSEVARVLELGYRGQPLAQLNFSVTAFHNRYDDLRTQEVDPGMTFVTFANGMQGRASGVELWGTWQAGARWRIAGGYTALHERLWLKPGSNDLAGPGSAGKDPSCTAQLKSTFDVRDGQQFELAVRRVAALDNPAVPAYTAVDARYLWSVRPGLEAALFGQNLNGSHGEYGAQQWRTEVPRSVGMRLTWQMANRAP
jgi:iron complex outermembrane receptor protein